MGKTAERTTIYVGAKNAELLRWAVSYVNAKSTSEGIFSALKRLREFVSAEEKSKRVELLRGSRGAWCGNQQIERAFVEIRATWPAPELREEP
jgi:hypothetical protein